MKTCTQRDKEAVLRYISGEPVMNLFIYGDIENFGVASPEVNVYVNERPDGGWDSLLLRYFDFYILYSRTEDFDAHAVGAFLRTRTVECLGGKTVLLARMTPWFPDAVLRPTCLCRCDAKSLAPAPALGPNSEVRALTVQDVPAAVEFYGGIEEFEKSYRGREEKARREMETNLRAGGMAQGVFCEGRLVAAAETSAANSRSAMVVSVATHAGFRGHGYATAALLQLCRASFEEGRAFLCLFYDNPAAGRIYRKAGFCEVGSYAMLQ